MTWVAVIGTALAIILLILKEVYGSAARERAAREKAAAEKTRALREQADRERAEALAVARERDRLVEGESEFDRALFRAKHPEKKED